MVTQQSIPTEILQMVTADQAWHYYILPFAHQNGTLKVYLSQNKHFTGIEEELEIVLDKIVVVECVEENELLQLIGRYYRKRNKGSNIKRADLGQVDSQNFLFDLISEAQNLGSSDIHIEAFEHRCRVRLRVDGVMMERFVIDRKDYPSLVNKIKIQANLDIAEKRLPQDGRIFLKANGERSQLDIRVSVLPSLHGEKVVMRLLNSGSGDIDLKQLGFLPTDLQKYLEGVKRPNGIILISGPTGSGKTTTLYATLSRLNQVEKNILTIEDPIEYTLEGITQVQLKEQIGLDFPSAMRTFLRQDPDVIMVGEIRDKATAEMAIRASLTGHLVLSTIHTKWSWGIVGRLIDMGIPPYLLADTLNTAIAQRLVRKLCPSCKQKQPFDAKLYPPSFRPSIKLTHHYLSQGCEECFYTGYQGRTAIYEVINIDNELSRLIKNKELDVMQHLKSKGFRSLADNAFDLFENGVTSLEEVYPILSVQY